MIWVKQKVQDSFSTVPCDGTVPSWCFLRDGTVPSWCFLRDGTGPSLCFFCDSTVLSRCFLRDGTVPSYNHHLDFVLEENYPSLIRPPPQFFLMLPLD